MSWSWVGIAAAVVLLVFAGLAAIHVLITYALWLVVHRQRGVLAAVPDREEVRRFLGALAREWWWTFVFFTLSPLGHVRWPIPRRALQGARPVLLVHGYTQNWTNLSLLALRLWRANVGPLYLVNLSPVFAPVETIAAHLSRTVDLVLQRTGATEVDVVAHSMGGLAARWVDAGDAERGARRIRRIVTLGSPHRGTVAAYLGVGASSRDLLPDSAFLTALPAPRGGRIISIRSRYDNLVLPSDCAIIGDGGVDLCAPLAGHFGLLADRDVASWVVQAITEVEPALISGRIVVAETAPSMRAEADP